MEFEISDVPAGEDHEGAVTATPVWVHETDQDYAVLIPEQEG